MTVEYKASVRNCGFFIQPKEIKGRGEETRLQLVETGDVVVRAAAAEKEKNKTINDLIPLLLLCTCCITSHPSGSASSFLTRDRDAWRPTCPRVYTLNNIYSIPYWK